MRKVCILAAVWAAATCLAPATVRAEGGLVAHYFQDSVNWDGNWPDTVSAPDTPASDWTFARYQYSRVEPVINHLFVRRGWFSARWTGFFDPAPGPGGGPGAHVIVGVININPNNNPWREFTLVLPGGSRITQDDLTRDYAGYEGEALSVHVKPKGNGNQNGLLVDGEAYSLDNAKTYDITASHGMIVRLYNDRFDVNGRAMGRWWIAITAADATIVCAEGAGSKTAGTSAATADAGSECEYVFEIWADDGCRLILDGKVLIDDWTACWEVSEASVRKAAPVKLTPGKHRLVVEYFQGQSLTEGDEDPMKLYWSSADAGIPRQIVPPACFSHDSGNLSSPNR